MFVPEYFYQDLSHMIRSLFSQPLLFLLQHVVQIVVTERLAIQPFLLDGHQTFTLLDELVALCLGWLKPLQMPQM